MAQSTNLPYNNAPGMKIESVHIENFRAFKDETIFLDDYTCLVGPNGGGKSTVLYALNIFFRETEGSTTDVINLSAEDFHRKNTEHPVKITVTFVDLDGEAQQDFKDYFRQGKLIISAVANFYITAGHAEVKHYGYRLGIQEFANFFEAISSGEKAAVLKQIFAGLREIIDGLGDASTKDGMVEALRKYEADYQERCVPIPSEDQFYGVSKGTNRLNKHVQWVYVPAVKDITAEQNENKSDSLGQATSQDGSDEH